MVVCDADVWNLIEETQEGYKFYNILTLIMWSESLSKDICLQRAYWYQMVVL